MKYLVPVMLVLVAAFTGCAKTPPSVPATPVADIRDDRLVFFTVCTDPKGLKVQYVFDWGNGDTETSVYRPSGETIFAARAFPDTGTFHIKVKARNEAGHMSKWSDECLFHASMPPQMVDTVVGFPRWAVDRWYRPSVKVMDPDGDSVSVKFIWGDSTASNWSSFVASGSTVTDSVKWQSTGRRVVRVVLKDKGSMVNQSAAAKSVNVSEIAVLWSTYECERYSDVSPTLGVIDGQTVVYGVCGSYEVFCLNADGTVRWTNSDTVPSAWYAASLSGDGSRLYAADESRGLYCLDARTGRQVWHLGGLAMLECTPAVGPRGAIYVTGRASAGTGALSRVLDFGDSARVEWTFPIGFQPTAAVALGGNGTVYCLAWESDNVYATLYAVSPGGAMLWKDTNRITCDAYRPAPVIDSRDRVIVGDDEGMLYCFTPEGALSWSTSVGDFYPGGISIGFDDRIYLQSYMDGRLYCYDSDGSQEWVQTFPWSDGALSNVCVASDGTILAYSSDMENLYCYNNDGDLCWQFSIWDSLYPGGARRNGRDEGDEYWSPAIGPDGNIYLAGDDCLFGVAWGDHRLASTAWPTYNHDNARSGWAGRQP